MENKDQPAFPFTTFSNLDQSVPVRYNGMNKRELIAAMAMQGILAGVAASPDVYTKKEIVRVAIEYSEELLKQLNNS